jgi:hypothetical protein
MKSEIHQGERILLVPIDELIRGQIHKLLFPLGRDWRELREEIERNGYRREHAIVVRPRAKGTGYEILDGLGRATVAEEKGLSCVPALVLEAGDHEALRYAAEARTSTPGGLGHRLVRRSYATRGRIELVLRAAGRDSEDTVTYLFM